MSADLDEATFEGYFFDLDGTLVDTAPDIHAALLHTLRAFDVPPVELARTRHLVGTGSRQLLIDAFAHHGRPTPDAAALANMLDVFLDHYRDHIAEVSTLYPGVAKTLGELNRRDAKLAVVTNKFEALANSVLDALGVREHFGAVVGGDTCATNKPSAAPAAHAATLLGGLTAERTLFVGDSETDVGCARAWGCPVCVVPYGYSRGTPADALGADFVIEELTILLD